MQRKLAGACTPACSLWKKTNWRNENHSYLILRNYIKSLLFIARGIPPTSRFCTSLVTDTIRTLISLQRYMPSQTLFTFLGFKGKFSSHYLDPFQLSDEIKDGGESGYSCVRDLMAVSFNQRKAFFSPAIIWQEIWMVFLKLER